MPPRQRYTKDEIVRAGFEIARKSGMSALTARSLASALSSSPKVIFGLFSGMDELKEEVMVMARDTYSERMRAALSRTDMLPYRSCGLCFVEFAHEEKELFRMLFMRDRKDITARTDDDTLGAIHSVIADALGVDMDTAMLMHRKYSVFAYGLACYAVNSSGPLDMEDTDRLLTENWEDLAARYRRKK